MILTSSSKSRCGSSHKIRKKLPKTSRNLESKVREKDKKKRIKILSKVIRLIGNRNQLRKQQRVKKKEDVLLEIMTDFWMKRTRMRKKILLMRQVKSRPHRISLAKNRMQSDLPVQPPKSKTLPLTIKMRMMILKTTKMNKTKTRWLQVERRPKMTTRTQIVNKMARKCLPVRNRISESLGLLRQTMRRGPNLPIDSKKLLSRKVPKGSEYYKQTYVDLLIPLISYYKGKPDVQPNWIYLKSQRNKHWAKFSLHRPDQSTRYESLFTKVNDLIVLYFRSLNT